MIRLFYARLTYTLARNRLFDVHVGEKSSGRAKTYQIKVHHALKRRYSTLYHAYNNSVWTLLFETPPFTHGATQNPKVTPCFPRTTAPNHCRSWFWMMSRHRT